MTWEETVESKREPLLSVVLGLIAAIGLKEGVAIERISKPLHTKVLRLLRTAESAVRRLIVAAARNIVVEPEPERERSVRPKRSNPGTADVEARPKRKRRPLFNMFDALKRLGRRRPKKKPRGPEPHVYSVEAFFEKRTALAAPAPVAQVDDGTVNAAPLVRRLLAVLDAVQDVQSYAMRLARWHAKPKEDRLPERWSPLRSGRPPGYRQKNIHEVDELLKECDWLARLGNPPIDDTS
jgi:hypothetical protein